MKKTNRLLALHAFGAAIMLAGATHLDAQTWVNVLDPAHDSLAGSSSDIGTDAAGNS